MTPGVPPHPAFAPLSRWLDDGVDGLTLERLNAIACACDPPPVTERRVPVTFVAPEAATSALSYEARILATGAVATRPGNRHDTFNALCWSAFPQVKRACNALHVAHASGGRTKRGPVRNALTLFDESGVIVLCAEPALGELLSSRQWKTLFSAQREAALERLRFFVCGHALYEKLLDPYPGITARVLIVPTERATLDCDPAQQCEIGDIRAAQILRSLQSPAEIPPLPLSGVPGWDPRNADPAFYDDQSVFRPGPHG